jgi:hypothetical protein
MQYIGSVLESEHFSSPVWQEILFIVMPEVIGFVHIYFCGSLFI